MKWTVDRIEEDIAVIETEGKTVFNVPIDAVPDGVREGDVISIIIDKDETVKRNDRMNSLANKLFAD